jgi:hypothetical protein
MDTESLEHIIENNIINNMLRLYSYNNNDFNRISNLRISNILSRRYYNVPPVGGYTVNEDEDYEIYRIENDDITSLVFLDTLNDLNNLNTEKNRYKDTLKSIGKYRKVKEDNQELINLQCSICIDSFKPNEYYRKLGCCHYFHKKCIDRWIKKDKNECPMCRNIII